MSNLIISTEYEITDEEIALDQIKDRDVEYKVDMCENLVNDNAILRKMDVTFARTTNANDIHSAIATIHPSIDNNLEMYGIVIGCPTVREASGQFSWLYFLPIRYENCAIDDYTFVFDRIERGDDDLHLRLTFLSKIIFENVIVREKKPKKSKNFFRKLCNCFLCKD